MVWTSTSAAIELSSFGHWTGSTGYAKAREDLTTDQLVALDGLCLATPTGGATHLRRRRPFERETLEIGGARRSAVVTLNA